MNEAMIFLIPLLSTPFILFGLLFWHEYLQHRKEMEKLYNERMRNA